uniref:Uncharacterized protein n=1 Tax=Spongospora subterranea TaxID=70186 RepID=A0A0H5QVQ4_9EUKA|eukprot:CRZ05995.1 hypothetical protein [Spongospora subterranea]
MVRFRTAGSSTARRLAELNTLNFHENLPEYLNQSGRLIVQLASTVRLCPDLLPGRLPALRQRIERFLRRENITIRRKTHEAQRTRQTDDLEIDFLEAVNQQITMLKLCTCWCGT